MNRSDEWEYVDEYPRVLEKKPLLKAARSVRVRAIDLIPKLITQIEAEALKMLDAVQRAKKIGESL